MGRAAAKKIKEFFGNKHESEESIEILRMFILPFAKRVRGRGLTVDDIVEMFFNTEVRRFWYAVALRDFAPPGALWRKTGGRAVSGMKVGKIQKGQPMLIVLDKKDNTAKLEVKIDNEYKCFLLQRFELDTIKDWIRIIDGEGNIAGSGDDGTESMEGSDNTNRSL